MPDYIEGRILLVGCGPMAQDYLKVLSALNLKVDVVGRSIETAAIFETKTGIKPYIGGIESFIHANEGKAHVYSAAIVATGLETLGEVVRQMARWGVKKVLTEKPGAKSIDELLELDKEMKGYGTNIFIAYNRRFYASVIQARRIIEEDGGVSSFNFEFTEWAHVISTLKKADGVKDNWFIGNSSHVIDLAFFLGGDPAVMSCFAAGKLEWHSVAVFSGAGVTANGALFAYQANWNAPGRWGIEMLTSKHRLYLRPLEKLQIQKIGTVKVDDFSIEDSLDVEYKPGLYKQVVAFLTGEKSDLISLSEQASKCVYYNQILKGQQIVTSGE